MLSGLKRGQYTEAAKLLGSKDDGFVMRIETVRQHARMEISDLLLYDEDLQREYINVRGLTRSIGILSKTPAAVIEACQEYYREVSVALPGKFDFVTVNGEQIRKMEMHGQYALHHRAFNEREKKRQKESWEGDTIPVSGPDSLYACSTLLYLSSDYCFLLVSIVGNVVKYNSNLHTPVTIVRKLVLPRKKQRKEAVQAVLEARGVSIDAVSSIVCDIVPGEPVYHVRVQPWVDRRKGIFSGPSDDADDGKASVVPVRLVRALVDPAKIREGRVDRQHMRVLYKKCRVSHLHHGKFFSLKPPEVVLGKRAGFYCGYHLRFEYQVPSFILLCLPPFSLPSPLFLPFFLFSFPPLPPRTLSLSHPPPPPLLKPTPLTHT